MTVWISSFCRGCLMAFHDGLHLYGRSGLRM